MQTPDFSNFEYVCSVKNEILAIIARGQHSFRNISDNSKCYFNNKIYSFVCDLNKMTFWCARRNIINCHHRFVSLLGSLNKLLNDDMAELRYQEHVSGLVTQDFNQPGLKFLFLRRHGKGWQFLSKSNGI